MKSNDLISIIIPVKNERDRIRTIIDGLYRQTYRPIEVIFVNGGSTDGTVEEIMNAIKDKEYSSGDFKVRLLREGDFDSIRSPANAKNIGFANARGVYVLFIDADYIILNRNFISRVVEALRNTPRVSVG